MAVLSNRTVLQVTLVVLSLAAVREWNIRRHLDGMTDWPRVEPTGPSG